MFGSCFVVEVSFLVLQSSRWGRECWLPFDVMRMFFLMVQWGGLQCVIVHFLLILTSFFTAEKTLTVRFLNQLKLPEQLVNTSFSHHIPLNKQLALVAICFST